jgi:modulator of FtsH protease HflK
MSRPDLEPNREDPGTNPWDRRPVAPPSLSSVFSHASSLLRRVSRSLARALEHSDGWPLGGVIAAMLLAWLASGLYLVGWAEEAVVTRFGRDRSVVEPGLHYHLPWPIETKTLVDTRAVDSLSDRTRVLLVDGSLVDVRLNVQYRRRDPLAFVRGVRDPKLTLGAAAERAARAVGAEYDLEAVFVGGRARWSTVTRERLQETLDRYHSGLEVVAVDIAEVAVPEPVAPAQRDVLLAREDQARLKTEAAAYGEEILTRARGVAAQQRIDAEAYRQQVQADAEGDSARFRLLAAEHLKAPAVVRERLYDETIEAVLGRAGKFVIDAKGQTFNLPLEALRERSPQSKDPSLPDVLVAPAAAGATPPDKGAASATVETPVEGRGRSRRSRS